MTLELQRFIDSKEPMRGQYSVGRLTSIVAVDLRGAIGCDNTLPWRLRTDMMFFREQTIGNTVIMGRKTYQSLGEKPLPRRNNIVLSHNNVLFASTPNCQLALSVEEALFQAARLQDDEVYVIGGAQTYAQFDLLVDRYLITIVDHQVPDADAFLSENVLHSIRDWKRRELGSHEATPNQDEFAFSIYEVSAPNPEERQKQRRMLIDEFASKVEMPSKRSPPRSSPKGATQDEFSFFAA